MELAVPVIPVDDGRKAPAATSTSGEPARPFDLIDGNTIFVIGPVA